MSLESIGNSSSDPALYSAARKRNAEKRNLSEGFVVSAYAGLEFVGIFLTGLLIARVYVGGILEQSSYYALYITPLLLGPILTAALLGHRGFYAISNLRNPLRISQDILSTVATAFVLLVLLGFMAGIASDYSRIWFVSWTLSSLGLIMFLRGLVSQVLAKLSNLDIRLGTVAFYGDVEAIQQISSKVSDEAEAVEVVGYFTENQSRNSGPKNSGLDRLIKTSKRINIDKIIICKSAIKRDELDGLLNRLSSLPSEVAVHPYFLGDVAKISKVTSFHDETVIRIQKKPISEWGLFTKAVLDRFIAATALVFLSPFMILAALAIKLESKGPAIFKQTRYGYNQREITVWKFRTMTVTENGSTFRQATKDDVRITRLGNILRRTSIDELPQLFNVLRGEMSLVGPRPHPIALDEEFRQRLKRYDNRHKVKPGITGWAQVNGYRGPTNKPGQMDKRIEYDLDYIENWSLWFDLKILIATPIYGLFGKNAF